MNNGTNQRQLTASISFGYCSVYTAIVGKNGGHRFEKGIGSITQYSTHYELSDHRDDTKLKFEDRKDIFKYLERKYKEEIEFFKYNPDLMIDSKKVS